MDILKQSQSEQINIIQSSLHLYFSRICEKFIKSDDLYTYMYEENHFVESYLFANYLCDLLLWVLRAFLEPKVFSQWLHGIDIPSR